MTLDGELARTAHRWAVDDPGLTQVNRVLTDWFWDPWTMRARCAVVVVWLVWRHDAWWLALWVAATCAVGTLIQQGLKAAVGRARPVWTDPVDSAHYAAYPSGHAMTATVVWGLILWLLRRYGAGRVLWRTACTLAVVSVVGVAPPHAAVARRALALGRTRRLAARGADGDRVRDGLRAAHRVAGDPSGGEDPSGCRRPAMPGLVPTTSFSPRPGTRA